MRSFASSEIALRDAIEADLSIFFQQQLDKTANYMAAFTSGDPSERDAFMKHWAAILSDDSVNVKTILFS